MIYILKLFSGALNRELVLHHLISFQNEIFVDFCDGESLNYLARRQDQWDLVGGVIAK